MNEARQSEFTRGFLAGLDSAVAAFEAAVNHSFHENALALQLSALMAVAVDTVREHVLSSKGPVQ